jgi:hypothetical protein
VASWRSLSNLGDALEMLGEQASGTGEACGAVAAYREALKEWTNEVSRPGGARWHLESGLCERAVKPAAGNVRHRFARSGLIHDYSAPPSENSAIRAPCFAMRSSRPVSGMLVSALLVAATHQ